MAVRGALDLIAKAGGGVVKGYPHDLQGEVATRHPERPVPEGSDEGVIAPFELASDD